MKMNLRNLRDLRLGSFRRSGMSDQQKRVLIISGIVVGTAALLTYPAILLYRYMRDRKARLQEQEGQEGTGTKSFAPSYRGSHKPHHRKAEANGNIQQAHA